MCELTFSDLGVLNKPYLIQQTIVNALANNNDGVGWMQDGDTWKSHISGAHMTNLGVIVRDSLNDVSPVAFHVRYATNKQLNEDCHSHPFVGEKLRLMHNGKLERKDLLTYVKYTEVDSEVFLAQLEAEIVTSPDIPIVDLFQSVMNHWTGKFAFIVYDTRDSNYYVIRGTTADLHQTTVNGKLVVNTHKVDLIKGTHVLNQMTQLTEGTALELGEIEALEVNTIYKFQPKDSVLEKVGELVENKAPLAGAAAWTGYQSSGTTAGTLMGRNQGIKPIYARYRTWMDFHGMSLAEVDAISKAIMGSSLVELTDDDIGMLYLEVLKTLTEQASVSDLENWRNIVKVGYCSWAYAQPEFKFPWMLNDSLDLIEMELTVESEVERIKIANKIDDEKATVTK
jgi:hypothetical protein